MPHQSTHTFPTPPLLQNAHLQTLFPTFFDKPIPPKVQIEPFTFADGDFIEAFWEQKSLSLPETTPIVTLFHGLAGSFASPYIQRIMQKLSKEGFKVVLMHFRGCSGKPNNLPRSYHSGDTQDAKAWLAHLRHTYPKAPLYGVGYSLGGNMLLKLLGESKAQSLLEKGIAVSAPLDLAICADKMDQGFSKLYQQHLLRPLKRSLLEKFERFDMQKLLAITPKDVESIDNFWKFDDLYTAPIHGFRDAKEYYRLCSAKAYLKTITTQTLILHALDDPFMRPEILPKPSELSASTQLKLTPHGGHVAFVSHSLLHPRYWIDEEIIAFLKL